MMIEKMKKRISLLMMAVTMLMSLCVMEFSAVSVKADDAEAHTITLEDGSIFPSKEITLIVPWSAGGNTDIFSRKLASLMETYLGQPIVITNTTGGGGQVGYNTLLRAAADGYTLCATSNSMILAPYTGTGDAAVKYEDVKHLGMWGSSACCIAVPADSEYQTLTDLLDAAEENPEGIRIANSGIGATWHACALNLENVAGVTFTHVPYDSGTEAVTAAAGGHVDAVMCGVAECESLVESGNLRVLAQSSENGLYPDVPTFEDEGISGMWGGYNDFIVPADTPDDVCDLLIAAMEDAVNNDEWKEFMEANGQTWVWMTGTELMDYYADLDASIGELF